MFAIVNNQIPTEKNNPLVILQRGLFRTIDR
jgi:hypothetical protein